MLCNQISRWAHTEYTIKVLSCNDFTYQCTTRINLKCIWIDEFEKRRRSNPNTTNETNQNFIKYRTKIGNRVRDRTESHKTTHEQNGVCCVCETTNERKANAKRLTRNYGWEPGENQRVESAVRRRPARRSRSATATKIGKKRSTRNDLQFTVNKNINKAHTHAVTFASNRAKIYYTKQIIVLVCVYGEVEAERLSEEYVVIFDGDYVVVVV